MKLFDTRLVITSLVLNLLAICALLLYWRPITQKIIDQNSPVPTCQEIMTDYTTRYADLEEQISFWSEEKFESGIYTDEERAVIQRIDVLDSRAGVILALCEAPLTEQTPFDPVPTVTEMPTGREVSEEGSSSAEPTQYQ